jgi:hypothetical protein
VVPAVAVAVAALVISGAGTLIVSANVAFAVPPLLVALSVTEAVPAAVGVPEISPVALLMVKPAGRDAAP